MNASADKEAVNKLESELAAPVQELVRGNYTEFAAKLAGVVVAHFGSPLAGGVASGLVYRIAALAADTATKRLRRADLEYETQEERGRAIRAFLAIEVFPQFDAVRALVSETDQRGADQLHVLAALSDEHFLQLATLMRRSVASREGQDELLATLLRQSKQLDEMRALLRAESQFVAGSTLPPMGRFVGRHRDREEIDRAFANPMRAAVYVVAGPSGVGKSHLAVDWAVANHERYPGGTYFISFDVDPGASLASLVDGRDGEMVAERASRARTTVKRPTLFIYDNIRSEEALRRWLPPPSLPAHVLVTTNLTEWPGYDVLLHEGIDDVDARSLFSLHAGHAADQYAAACIRHAGGLAIQLVADARYVRHEIQHQRERAFVLKLAEQTSRSFERNLSMLDADAQLLTHVAALFNEAAIPIDELGRLLAWDADRVDRSSDAAVDYGVLSRAGNGLRMHGLVAAYVRERQGVQVPVDVHERRWRCFVEAANDFVRSPAEPARRARLVSHPSGFARWGPLNAELVEDIVAAGYAWLTLGRFEDTLAWLDRAIAIRSEAPNTDPSELGRLFGRKGFALRQLDRLGEAKEALRAGIRLLRQGDRHARVNHNGVAVFLRNLGICLLSSDPSEAQPIFEDAVAEAKLGDLNGTVDWDNVATNVHFVGESLFQRGEFEGAQKHFEQVMSLSEIGDPMGRIDHAGFGYTLVRLGQCSAMAGRDDEAEHWLQRAACGDERGLMLDGRFDHALVARSMFMLAEHLLRKRQQERAKPWLEKAIDYAKRGDVYGRIDASFVAQITERLAECGST